MALSIEPLSLASVLTLVVNTLPPTFSVTMLLLLCSIFWRCCVAARRSRSRQACRYLHCRQDCILPTLELLSERCMPRSFCTCCFCCCRALGDCSCWLHWAQCSVPCESSPGLTWEPAWPIGGVWAAFSLQEEPCGSSKSARCWSATFTTVLFSCSPRGLLVFSWLCVALAVSANPRLPLRLAMGSARLLTLFLPCSGSVWPGPPASWDLCSEACLAVEPGGGDLGGE
mmetsp:Transcript_10921/g.44686  ORF Transcript_10921/g.44686 Transcript_10921/m.44686 type:complete len:228 (+) Transcript_10921:894-1577(+)